MSRRCFTSVLVLSILLCGVASPAAAQSPIDVLPGSDGSNPHHLTAVDGTLYFSADDQAGHRSLWKSEGTTSSTEEMVDLNAGGDDRIQFIEEVNGTVFFAASDGTHGVELWTSDGTAGGTSLVKDINPNGDGLLGRSSSSPTPTVYNNHLYFWAKDGSSGAELWKSDGTSRGTVLVKEINTGSNNDGGSFPNQFAEMNGTLYFEAWGPNYHDEIWATDGTTVGTRRITDQPEAWNPSELTVAGGRLFFSLTVNPCINFPCSGNERVELGTNDGTSGGTTVLGHIAPSSTSSGSTPMHLTAVNGTLLFEANDGELWRSEGTTANTTQVQTFNVSSPQLRHFTPVQSEVYFAVTGQSSTGLWTSDGSSSGTTRLTTVPYDCCPQILEIGHTGATVFFSARDPSHNTELWWSGGTTGTTRFLNDLYPGAGNPSSPQSFTSVGATLFFRAENGTVGRELWTTGPTTTRSFSAGDSPERSLPGLDLTIDIAQASNAFALTAFRDSNLAASALPLPGSQEPAAPGLWTVAPGNSGNIEADVCFGFDRLTAPRSAIQFSQLRVYRRPDPNSSWSRVADSDVHLRSDGTAPDPDAICATITSFSQFAVTGEPTALPVELASLEATPTGASAVELTWTTASEKDNAGFHIQHKSVKASGRNASTSSKASTDGWASLGRVDGAGTTDEPQSYRFTAEDLSIGTHQFRLNQIDLDGTEHVHAPVTVELQMQAALRLSAPAPNPVRQQATVSFAVKEQADTQITLFNALGQEVRTVYRGTPSAGEPQTAQITTENLANGVYFLHLRAEGRTRTQQFTILQ